MVDREISRIDVPTRRGILAGGGALLAALSLPGCDLLSTDPASKKQGNRAARQAKEAPDLAEMVKAGKLPRLSDRMPKKPLVIKPVERMGVYGGEWNGVILGATDTAWPYMTAGYDQLVGWDPAYENVVPNVAESVDPSDGGRTYTIRLREGMKWSDGEPFSADDVMFWYDAEVTNKAIYPVMPPWLVVDGKPAVFTKVDALTVKVSFAAPAGMFLQYLATPGGQLLTTRPQHYLQQFHPDYEPKAKDAAKAAGQTWTDFFESKADVWRNADLPTLCAWHVSHPFGKGTRVVLERNPYYWKTDPEGRQLPYIDRIAYDVISDPEVVLLKASNGEIDMDTLHVNVVSNKPVLARSSKQNGYRLFDIKDSGMNSLIIALNLVHEDPQLRKVFRNKDFRIGLSHAIDRKEIINAAFQRQGEPWQAAPRKESAFYDEEMAKQYTEYDPDRANDYLDRAGLTRRDAQGFRLRPDGERLSFAVEVSLPDTGGRVDAMELVTKHWKKVGVQARVKAEDRSLFYERKQANKHDGATWGGAGGATQEAILDPRWYFPYTTESNFGVPWANWYNKADGPSETPPAATRRQMELYDKLKSTVDNEAKLDLFRQILQIAKEEFYVIGTVAPAGMFGIVKTNFHNVPEPMWWGWQYPPPGPTRTEQYFIES